MADLAVVESSVIPGDFTVLSEQTYSAGDVNLSAGVSVYLNGDSEWMRAQANAVATSSGTVGIMVCRAYPGQPCFVATDGILPMGSSVLSAGTKGLPYGISANAGKIAPLSDLVNATNCPNLLGFSDGAGNLVMSVASPGVQI